MSTTTLPRPRPCLITALEILGLDDPNIPEGRARNALFVIETTLFDGTYVRPEECSLSLTGRRLVLVAPIKRRGTLPYFLMRNLVFLQLELAEFGLLVRGGITLGDAASDGAFVVGPGVTRAEQLRDQLALFPRVIVDPQVLREIEQNADLRPAERSGMLELGYLRTLVRQDLDGLWFLDYLGRFIHHREILVEQHHGMVVHKLEEATSLGEAARSAAWLASYHNRTLDDLQADGRVDDAARAALTIPATGPLLYSFPPSAKAP